MSKTKGTQFVQDGVRNRHFSEAFKRSKVKEILSKRLTVLELSRQVGISRTSAYRWLYRYSDLEQGVKTVVQMESEQTKTAYYRDRVAELERLYGQKQIEVAYLEKALELASEELGYDLKKTYVPQPWNGSVVTSDPTATR